MASVLAAVAGLVVPAGCTLAAWVLVGSPVRTMLAVTLAALLNTPSPLGGGMGAQGVLRVRWMRWEWTFDGDRSLFEAVAGTFLMSAVTVGGFFLAAPVLRHAASQRAPGAADLHARCLDHLQSRAEPQGGFSAYPSGLARVEYTARALDALRGRLDEASLQRHRAALLACRKEDGRFGRSATAPTSEEATRWARRELDQA